MKIHQQSSVQMNFDKKTDEFIGYGERRRHYALSESCPVADCSARPGGPCKAGGTFMSPLAVHAERAEKAVMGGE